MVEGTTCVWRGSCWKLEMVYEVGIGLHGHASRRAGSLPLADIEAVVIILHTLYS